MMDHRPITTPHGSDLLTDPRRLLAEAASRVRILGARADLAHEGDRPTECSLILDGFVCRYKLLSEGRRQILGFHIAGDLCGLAGFGLGRMDHSLATLSQARIAVITRSTLRELTTQRPNLTSALWQQTLRDAAMAHEWMINLGRRTAYQRIAHLLCEMGLRLQMAGRAQDNSFDWPVTQAALADAMGLTPVHVNRVLQQLRGEGLIVLRGAKVTILDWNALSDAAEFDPDYLGLTDQEEPLQRPRLARQRPVQEKFSGALRQ
jgi:CRP-like cAMP-binding protein